MLFVGIDAAKSKHDCCIIDSNGVIITDSLRISNKKEGFDTLYTSIISALETKKMKLQYSTRTRQSKNHYFGSGYIETPKIQMEGKWLETLGFHIGDAIQVAYEEGSTHISLVAPI